MRESVILAITDDKYELPILLYDNTRQMAQDLGLSREHCQCMISRNTVYGKLKCRFIRVYLDETNSTKGGNVMSEKTKAKTPTAKKLLAKFTLRKAASVLAKLDDDTRESLVSDIWNEYHKLSLAKGV